ncbi:MAG: AMP-binding protein, partial [Gammaproteobacteria bacterium]|nr:AMP-binding protein [Gammaproteobacteria bacterium]
FQVMFNFHSEPAQRLALGELSASRIAAPRRTAKFDLTASVVEQAGGIGLMFEYDADLFDAATMEALLGGYLSVLHEVGEDAGLRVGQLAVLDADSRDHQAQQRREARARQPLPLDVEGSLGDRLVAQGRRRGEAQAVGFAGGSWSYAQLLGYGQAVAAGIATGAGAGSGRVGLLLGHDEWMVAGLLGAVLAGRSYVPLDAYAPEARNRQVLIDAGVVAVVTDRARRERAPWLEGCALPLIVVDESIGATATSLAMTTVAPAVAPDQEAYLLYTSGTTGAPKGVVQSHRHVLGQVGLWSRSLGLVESDRLSLFAGYGYDAAVQDLFGALLTGASVHLYDLRGAESAPELIDRIAAERVSVLHFTPTVYRHLFGGRVTCTQDLSAVRLVVLGGERARRSDLELFRLRFRRGARLVNGLGLTESTMGLQFCADHDTRVVGEGLPVGAAVAGLEAWLLDEQGEPDVSAWRGELGLVGEYLTPGYHGDAELTRRRLRRLPDGRVLLRTGDLVRRLPGGELLHEGRCDRQVKIRGIRIEPAEVEAALGALLPGVECAVMARADAAGESTLVAYLAETGGGALMAEAELRAGLRARLPESLVPAAFVWLGALPRRANGKLDEAALPAPRAVAAGATLPRGESERRLCEIWSGLLGRESVGVHDDFFVLGGHSLLATRLIARVRDAFAVELPLLALFENPTVAGMAEALEHTARRTPSPGLPALRRRVR